MEMAAETLPTPDRWTSLLIPIRLAFHRTSALHNRLHYRSAGSALPTLRIGRAISPYKNVSRNRNPTRWSRRIARSYRRYLLCHLDNYIRLLPG